MTHSPTPEEIDAVYGVEDPVETLTVLAGLHCTDAAPLIARIRADAVAEYKAEHVSAAEVRAAALVAFPGVDWREPSVIYDDALTAYANRNIATTSKLRAAAEAETDRCMLAQNKAMIDARRILEAARGAR